MDELNPTQPGAQKGTGPTLFLSLFLLLLAFFILLNAISVRDDAKTRALIDSLVMTFQPPKNLETSKFNFISALGETPSAEELMRSMKQSWDGATPHTKVQQLSSGRVMLVTAPLNEYFIGRESTIRGDRQDLIEQVAQTLAAKGDGLVNELQFVLDPDGVKDRSGKVVEGVQMARLAEFVRLLIARGAPPDTVTVGFKSGLERNLQLRYFVRDEARAYLTFDELAQ
ncbi:MAG: hypothetical protein JKY20_06940 [Alphaproteobacteria bacterium]|nr:hypothetical protein [Alphaproteobacteria bacterium]